MAAPAVPTSLAVAYRGHVHRNAAAGRQAALITWERPSPLPSPVEHYEVQYVPSVGSPVAVATTGNGATSQLVDIGAITEPYDDEGDVEVRAVNADGSSAWVTLTDYYPAFQQPDTDADLALATSVNVPSVTTTTALVTWDTSSIDTFANEWVILLRRGTALEVEITVPFWQYTRTITGLLPGTGYQVQVFARYKPNDLDAFIVPLESAPQPEAAVEFVTDGDAAITGPAEIVSAANGIVAGTFEVLAGGVQSWAIAGAPSGVAITARDAEPTFKADLSGTAEEPGIYDATVTARYRGATGDTMLSLPVRFIIGGQGYLSWLHDDPFRAELQIDVRTGAVTSFAFDLEAGVRLVRGDTRKIHVVLRDGARVLDTVPTELTVAIRPPHQFDAEPYLRVQWDSADVDDLGGADRAFVELTPEGDDIDAIFAALNASNDGQANSAALDARMEITLVAAGVRVTAQPVTALIVQDYDA